MRMELVEGFSVVADCQFCGEVAPADDPCCNDCAVDYKQGCDARSDEHPFDETETEAWRSGWNDTEAGILAAVSDREDAPW